LTPNGMIDARDRLLQSLRAIDPLRDKDDFEAVINEWRKSVGEKFNDQFDATVAYGPFAGLKLSYDRNSWGLDRASMLFGIYEQNIVASLMAAPERYTTFIEIGATDGYYGLGALHCKKFESSYLFESDNNIRRVLHRNCELNALSDRATVLGDADEYFYQRIPPTKIENSVLFLGVEGGEFDILTKAALAAFKHSIIFIELHDFQVANGTEKLDQLMDRAADLFEITELTGTQFVDVNRFKELTGLSDNLRAILFSEGRRQWMKWLRLSPRLHAARL